ncbi:MAG: hypothetical protein ABSE56_21785 [Bryobacteraceae bacterium]
MKSWVRVSIPGVALLIAAPVCFAQGRVSEFLGVQNWHGTVKVSGTGSGSTSGGIYSDVWDYGITTNLTIQLDTYNPNIQGWTGTFTGSSAVNAKDVATFGGCNETFTQVFQGSVGGAGTSFTMRLQGTNQYVFYPSVYEAPGATSSTNIDCAPGPVGGTGPVTFSPVLSDKIQTLPATGFNLTGSQQVTMNSPLQPLSLVFGGQPAQIQVTVEWSIQPGLLEQAEVVVQKTPEFQNWRPTAGVKGARGNPLNLTAKLQAKGGGPTNERVAYFIWELTQCSKEPGYAMNAPLDSPSRDFDLKIESGTPSLIPLDTLGQKAQTQAGQLTDSSIVLAPYDWGAFGKVKVTAVMPDTSQIVGYLDGDPSQTDVRLPMRSDSSLIADVWKKDHGVEGLADVSDNETDPNGDGSAGDGLTLYEEYRGFIIDGQHVEGDPKKKDYFIVNTAGWSYLSGLKMFQNLSGLAVHYLLKQTEMPLSRVINPNHDQGAHIVDQHGVVISAIAADAGYAKAVGGPGTPKSISQVITPKILPGAAGDWIDYLASGLAHELFHACNVYHHGDAGYPSVEWELSSSTKTVIEVPSDIAVTVLDESGAPYPLPADTVAHVSLGVADDPHTGDDNCVMRYDDARGYYSQANPATVRYCFKPKEPAGTSLCTSTVGTGVNAPGRTPQPRYGNAAAGRGNCRGQILVNDNVPAPRR